VYLTRSCISAQLFAASTEPLMVQQLLLQGEVIAFCRLSMAKDALFKFPGVWVTAVTCEAVEQLSSCTATS